jgi:hypothetical protein
MQEVTYPEAWPGVSVEYAPANGAIAESTYRIKDGLSRDALNRIRLRYNRPVRVDESGNLVIRFEQGEMREAAPVAWQEQGGVKHAVAARYKIVGQQEVGFVAQYDPHYPLVIDPVLTWNTFLGGSGTNYGTSITVDGNGNVYVGGYSSATWGTPVQAFGGGSDEAFAAKLNSSGELLWNTFLGGGWSNIGRAIAVDGNGNVYVGGYSNATWGMPVQAFGGGSEDAFAAKLNNSGVLLWNTFLGGSGANEGNSIAVDGIGNVYVAGLSTATWGSPVRAFSGSQDAFAAKLNSSGGLAWNTFLGGSGNDRGQSIAVDGNGNVYVGGYSTATWGSPVRAFGGGEDAFAAKINSSGVLLWNTFLGGSGNDRGQSIAVDGNGNVYVGGNSTAIWGSPVQAFSGSSDAFAAELNNSGGLLWNTFLGGSGADYGNSIAVDGNGNVYMGGYSTATWGSPVQAFVSGSYDAFAAVLNSSGGVVVEHVSGRERG